MAKRVFHFGIAVAPERIARLHGDFGPGGGFVWATIHNIQYNVPPENIVAALDTVRECGRYPLAE